VWASKRRARTIGRLRKSTSGSRDASATETQVCQTAPRPVEFPKQRSRRRDRAPLRLPGNALDPSERRKANPRRSTCIPLPTGRRAGMPSFGCPKRPGRTPLISDDPFGTPKPLQLLVRRFVLERDPFRVRDYALRGVLLRVEADRASLLHRGGVNES
jgi:hypothetical protein